MNKSDIVRRPPLALRFPRRRVVFRRIYQAVWHLALVGRCMAMSYVLLCRSLLVLFMALRLDTLLRDFAQFYIHDYDATDRRMVR